MEREIIFIDKAPAPIGPYNQAVKVGNMLYLSGQVPIEPRTGELVANGIENETVQVMGNIGAILEAAGMDFANIVKCSIFIADMKKFSAVNSIYKKYFIDNQPARETVEVSALPKGVGIEISCIAVH